MKEEANLPDVLHTRPYILAGRGASCRDEWRFCFCLFFFEITEDKIKYKEICFDISESRTLFL